MVKLSSVKLKTSVRMLITLYFLFAPHKNFADSLDSLKILFSKAANDSVKIAILTQLSELCDEQDIITYANENLGILEKAFSHHKISQSYYNLEKARSLYNIGYYHFTSTSNYIETINYVLNSIRLIETKAGNNVDYLDLLSTSYNTIATAYIRMGKNELAKTYLLKSIEIDKKLDKDDYLTNDYNNLASAYYALHDYDKAIYYFNEAITIARKDNDTALLSIRYCNIAEMFFSKKDIPKVETYLNLALNNLKGQPQNSNYFHYYRLKFKLFMLNHKLSEAKKIIPIIQQMDVVNNYEYSEFLRNLHEYYIEVGEYKLALETYKHYKAIQDSAVNETIKVKSEVKQLTFDFEKKQLDEKNKNELKLTREKEKRQQQTVISIAVFLLCLIIAVFSFVFYKKLKLTQKQNKIIEEQNSEIQHQHQLLEVKNKSITDSINYSKSIQSTLLEHYNQFNSYFKESYIIYEPKDVIGGDFYWTQKQGENILVVVGDCTGHGVPGAMISVLAMEALNKIYPSVTDFHDLEDVIKRLRSEFNKYYESDSLVSIGIDLSIIYIDKTNRQISLGGSGASIIGLSYDNVTRYKFDSYNIGGNLPATYTDQTKHIPMESNQTFYLFTDGIVDMKGGPLKKKYGMKSLEALLICFKEIPFSQQKENMEQLIADWNKGGERIDDITFLAVKL